MGLLWEHIRETGGKVKMMLPPAREHHFQGPRGPREAPDGRLSEHSFLACVSEFLFHRFFKVWSPIGGPLPSLLVDFWHVFSEVEFYRF